MNRRECLQTLSALSTSALLPRRAWPQQTQDPLAAFRAQIGATPIKSQPLADNLTLLSGPGGNVVVLKTFDGLVMVDTFVQPAWPKLEEQLKSLAGGAPINKVINTHWHFDHVDNNAPLHAAGALLVAHENTKARMSSPQHIAMLNLDFPPSPAAALPQQVLSDDETSGFRANSELVWMGHVPQAHTDTDLIVSFERANVLHAGDVFFNGRYPLIDWSSGGRIDGMIAASNRLLHIAKADTKIVPGHGALATKADLVRYRDMLVTAAARVRKLKAAGKTLEEAIAAKPFTDLDADWGGGRYKGDDFVKIVYLTL
jgi:cyclase